VEDGLGVVVCVGAALGVVVELGTLVRVGGRVEAGSVAGSTSVVSRGAPVLTGALSRLPQPVVHSSTSIQENRIGFQPRMDIL
jgi:hypothetical protein